MLIMLRKQKKKNATEVENVCENAKKKKEKSIKESAKCEMKLF